MTSDFAALLNEIEARDAADSLERATGWTVLVTHVEHLDMRTLYGHWREPAAAIEWAEDFVAGLNIEGEDGFLCIALPILPAGDS